MDRDGRAPAAQPSTLGIALFQPFGVNPGARDGNPSGGRDQSRTYAFAARAGAAHRGGPPPRADNRGAARDAPAGAGAGGLGDDALASAAAGFPSAARDARHAPAAATSNRITRGINHGPSTRATGTWSAAEHDVFFECVKLYGVPVPGDDPARGQWTRFAEEFKNRFPQHRDNTQCKDKFANIMKDTSSELYKRLWDAQDAFNRAQYPAG